MAKSNGGTYYSEKIEGARGNYNWPVSFDVTDGYVGISQLDGGKVNDRVLLSPHQFKALVSFIEGGFS